MTDRGGAAVVVTINVLLVTLAVWEYFAEPNGWIYALPFGSCAVCSLINAPQSGKWRLVSSAALLGTGLYSIFLMLVFSNLHGVKYLDLVEERHLLPLGIAPLPLIAIRLKNATSRARAVQAVLLYLLAGTALTSILYGLTQYYIRF